MRGRSTSSRRAFLASGAAAAAATALPAVAGCLGRSAEILRLSAYERESLPDSVLLADPTAPTARFAIDYPDRYKRDRYRTLIRTGSMTVLNYQLTYTYEFGSETREAARFVVDVEGSGEDVENAAESDATYYRVHIDDQRTVEREWWEFYLDLVDDPPADAEGVTPPIESLSEPDRRIVDAALGAVYADRNPPIDVGGDAFGTRGPLYHEFLDADDSTLVPDPPFEHVRSNDRWFAARAEQGTATPTETTYSVEPVANTRAGFEDHVRSTLVRTDLSPESLSDGERDVVRTAVRTPFYEEDLPMSASLRSVMERLGAGEHLPADDAFELGVEFDHLFATVDGTAYAFDLSVQP
ncbi:hypothetical protein SAMN05192561_101921 [Halopenitus malekzadehii]|uniref:Uncharacterized protein n=1 Tax=Halopenitus malekzadehii TaxID=1267564 RepID=A0A1H6I8B5_9EURY|nr:hypothetical protein [Halopenitus malekzadehii]SEH42572.1 hypothetical protein SAMN05192561_101921 [Halopenitus malekzadehii]